MSVKWEYLHDIRDLWPGTGVTQEMNKRGEEGWELVSVQIHDCGEEAPRALEMYFKRPK
jgi:hypothetical protein